MMITRAYTRCNSGHYFMGEFCPFDGWSSSASRELTKTLKRFAGAGRPISLEALQKAGVSDATIAGTIVISFGSAGCVFDAISPEYYIVNGESIPFWKLDESFT
jgi:hypothetical protein